MGDAGMVDSAVPTSDASAGAVGDLCAVNEDCSGGLCAGLGETFFCTQSCASATECPGGYVCDDAAAVCAPEPERSRGGGCSVGGGRGEGAAGVVFAALLVTLWRRRRR